MLTVGGAPTGNLPPCIAREMQAAGEGEEDAKRVQWALPVSSDAATLWIQIDKVLKTSQFSDAAPGVGADQR